MPTVSKEDYIKAAYKIKYEENIRASTKAIAARLNISNAATSEMAKRLASEGFIKYEKYKELDLTALGENLALNVIRRHRLWELFLMKVLNLTWSEVHEEAEKLEHQSSDNLIDKIDSFLDYPSFDPHGEPIPSKSGKIPSISGLHPMSRCREGFSYQIRTVISEAKNLLEHLSSLDIGIKTSFQVVQRVKYDNSLRVSIDGNEHFLSEKITDKILVKQI